MTTDTFRGSYLEEFRRSFAAQKTQAEKALRQVSDGQFFAVLDPESNSLAILTKHLGGNLRSRWRDFLVTDGEKPDRNRDTEFIVDGSTREQVMAVWDEGWGIALAQLDRLRPDDLGGSVAIRGEPLTVLRALNRQLVHTAHHVGQIVLLAKHHSGPRWETLSIPRGGSEQYLAEVQRRHEGGA